MDLDEHKGAERTFSLNSRRKAREAALQALYSCDTLGDCSKTAIDFFFSHFHPDCSESSEPAERENLEFAKRLVVGVIEQLAAVDGHISGASAHWSVGRMARVDRNILRIGAFEIAFIEEIPVSVTINEAIEISKRFGSPDSPTFINGVLDNIAKGVAGSDSEIAKRKMTGTAG